MFYRFKLRKLQIKLGFPIPSNVFGPGLSIAHYGTIVVSEHASIGCNCRIHVGVNIGALLAVVLFTVAFNPDNVPFRLLNVTLVACVVLLFAFDVTAPIAVLLVKYSFLYNAVALLLTLFDVFG